MDGILGRILGKNNQGRIMPNGIQPKKTAIAAAVAAALVGSGTALAQQAIEENHGHGDQACRTHV